jgi:hypothetical protein
LSPDDQVVLPHNTTLTEGQPVAAEVAQDTTPEGEPH